VRRLAGCRTQPRGRADSPPSRSGITAVNRMAVGTKRGRRQRSAASTATASERWRPYAVIAVTSCPATGTRSRGGQIYVMVWNSVSQAKASARMGSPEDGL
jgi:hypothetical protein